MVNQRGKTPLRRAVPKSTPKNENCVPLEQQFTPEQLHSIVLDCFAETSRIFMARHPEIFQNPNAPTPADITDPMIQAFKFMGTFSPPVTNPGSESTAINERAFQPLPNGSRTIVGASPGAGAFTGADMPQAASPSHTGVPASSRGPIKSAKPSKATRATRATKFPQRALHTIVETSSGGAGPSSGAGESQVASTSHTGASSSIGPIKGAKPSKAKRAVKTPKKSNGKNPRL